MRITPLEYKVDWEIKAGILCVVVIPAVLLLLIAYYSREPVMVCVERKVVQEVGACYSDRYTGSHCRVRLVDGSLFTTTCGELPIPGEAVCTRLEPAK